MILSQPSEQPSVSPFKAPWPIPARLAVPGNSGLCKIRPLWDSLVYRDLGNMPRGRERGEKRLIKLTRINGDSVTVNSDLIMFVETAGETTITLSNGDRMKVREDVDRLRGLVLEFKRAVFGGSIVVDNRECPS